MRAELALSLGAILPELVLAGGAMLLLAADLVRRRGDRGPIWWGVTVALVALGALARTPGAPDGLVFGGQLSADGLAAAARLLVLVLLLLTFLISLPFGASRPAGVVAEYVVLLLFAAAGLSGLAASRHWVVLFIFLEMASIAFATLLGARRDDRAAREAALKYFLLSAFSTAFLVYGLALLWRSGGSFVFGSPQGWGPSDRLALCLIGTGLAFKCALAPFHMWAPDVYEGGPTPVVGFMAAASKSVGFFVLARVVLEGGAGTLPGARAALAVIAALSMVTGTLLALPQRNLKRMLAYSGVAHAGYVATAFSVGGPEAMGPVLAYLLAYALMSFGAFAVIAAAEGAGLAPTVDGFRGLARRAPGLALMLAVFMVSLTGLPPTAGFFAKFLVFRLVLENGGIWLVLLAVAMSVVSVGFYLRLLVPVYMEGRTDAHGHEIPAPEPLAISPEGWVAILFLAILILGLGLHPQPLLAFGGLTGAP